MSDFYEFEHRCDAMPDSVRFCKINGFNSQFTVEKCEYKAFLHSTTFYGFRFCPYCGEDMEVRDD